ncbi:MAG: type II toxin-antitoxin system Phd/YefM family antitoxin [Burkholderiales bacterium]
MEYLDMERRFSIAEARNSLSGIVHTAEKNGPVTLTRRGKPVAVVVSEADFSRLGRNKKDYWDALQEFLATRVSAEDALTDADFDALRDKDGGRDFTWGK